MRINSDIGRVGHNVQELSPLLAGMNVQGRVLYALDTPATRRCSDSVELWVLTERDAGRHAQG